MSYVQGFLLAVPEANKQAYRDMAEKGWALFKGYGALSMQENWGHQVPDGKVTSFPMAVKLEPGEVVVFSWIVWPDAETAQAAAQKMMEDPEMANWEMPFDGMRMIWGGFEVLYRAEA